MPQSPLISPTLYNQTLALGQRCMFQIRATGIPTPNVVWKFNGQPLTGTPAMQVSRRLMSFLLINMNFNFQLIFDQNGWSRLIIARVEREHGGIYSVEAQNDAGVSRTEATLIINVPATVMPASSTQVIEIRQTSTTASHTPPPPPIPKHQYQQQSNTHMFEEYMEKDVQELGIVL